MLMYMDERVLHVMCVCCLVWCVADVDIKVDRIFSRQLMLWKFWLWDVFAQSGIGLKRVETTLKNRRPSEKQSKNNLYIYIYIYCIFNVQWQCMNGEKKIFFSAENSIPFICFCLYVPIYIICSTKPNENTIFSVLRLIFFSIFFSTSCCHSTSTFVAVFYIFFC